MRAKLALREPYRSFSCMSLIAFFTSIGLILLSLVSAAFGQAVVHLKTTETDLVLEAGASSPRVVTLTVPGEPAWTNRSSEGLIPFVVAGEKQLPVRWALNSNASQVNDQQVSLVYESPSPHLRLTWEWRVPQAYGPIEH